MLVELAALLGLSAVQPPAQAAAGASPEIVVEGVRDVERQVSEFVRALTDVPASAQISRFEWAVCPSVAGLSAAQNLKAAARMRQVAEAAGIPLGGSKCKPNVLLVVTGDKRGFVRSLAKDYPDYFEDVSTAELRRMIREDTPAAAWHVAGLLDADGVEVPRDRETGQYVLERTDVPSRISASSSSPHFAAAIVVVDSDSLDGLTVVQLADYAAMRAFARTDPAQVAATTAPTILTILDTPIGGAVPITLTRWDLAYLKALYASTGNRLARQQRREISRGVTKELQQPQQEQKKKE